jgi:hypothetical protein
VLRNILPIIALAAAALTTWLLAEPRAAALKCIPPRGVYVLELTNLELLEGAASLEDEQARLDGASLFDASFMRISEDEVIYFERVSP